MLSEHRVAPPLSRKSFTSIIALFMLIFTPIVTGMPVHEAAFLSACVVVFAGAITMEQVYREIDWRVVFLLAFITPLGQAVQHVTSGDAIGHALASVASTMPAPLLMAIFMVLASLLSQAIDSSVAVIFLGPIAIALGKFVQNSPHTLLMSVALGSSLAFILPTSCRANLLVAGAGGYRPGDFVRVGIPFSIAVGLSLIVALSFLG